MPLALLLATLAAAPAPTCEWVTPEQAEQARQLLQQHGEHPEFFVEWCSTCGDPPPFGREDQDVATLSLEVQGERARVVINGKARDLARLYQLQSFKDSLWTNIALKVGCQAPGVAPQLTTVDLSAWTRDGDYYLWTPEEAPVVARPLRPGLPTLAFGSPWEKETKQLADFRKVHPLTPTFRGLPPGVRLTSGPDTHCIQLEPLPAGMLMTGEDEWSAGCGSSRARGWLDLVLEANGRKRDVKLLYRSHPRSPIEVDWKIETYARRGTTQVSVEFTASYSFSRTAPPKYLAQLDLEDLNRRPLNVLIVGYGAAEPSRTWRHDLPLTAAQAGVQRALDTKLDLVERFHDYLLTEASPKPLRGVTVYAAKDAQAAGRAYAKQLKARLLPLTSHSELDLLIEVGPR